MQGFPEPLVVASAVFHSLLTQEQAVKGLCEPSHHNTGCRKAMPATVQLHTKHSVCDLAKAFSQELELN